MTVLSSLIPVVERVGIPDAIARPAIAGLVARTNRALAAAHGGQTAPFVQAMADRPIATHVSEANTQHYELPPEFFELVLGPRCKYSCCYYGDDGQSLAEAEVLALDETVARADIRDGQTILDLGCGWGSFALFTAERFPNASILAVSNSHTQKAHIEKRIAELGLANLSVQTADMNTFQPDGPFDRVVSIEMFEHMSNWPKLLARIRSWLRSDGRLFVHVFSHRTTPYRFDAKNSGDWIAQHFFSGGIMPSHDLMAACASGFEVEADWRWSGWHYAQTARHWLENFTKNADAIDVILRDVYGPQERVWRQRWRLFFLATEGLFGHNGGDVWGVSHYRLAPITRPR